MHVQRALVAGVELAALLSALERPLSDPLPLGGLEVVAIGHLAQLAKKLEADRRTARRARLDGARQAPGPAGRILDQALSLEIRQRPGQLVVDQGVVLLTS